MRYYILTCVLTLTGATMFGQSKDIWTSFWNKDSSFIGFKDSNGVVRIAPKFQAFTSEIKFEDIIIVTEDSNEKRNSYYYLTKSGRMLGKDSVYRFDNGPDCESEGFIRFHDNKTDKVGMFNRNGDVAIPAEYDELTKVRNGMTIGIKGAKRKRLGEDFFWKGGKDILIDTNNRTLIDSFRYTRNLNFFSVLVSPQPNTDSLRQNFKGINGQYYSFIDFDKEFRSWLKSSLLCNLTKDNLLKNTNKDVFFWKESNGWMSEERESFIERNYVLIEKKLLQLKSKDCSYDIFDEDLSAYNFESAEYKDYFSTCGEAKSWIYPVKNIVISYKDKKDLAQDNFEFLRTKDGYRLIEVSVRKDELK